MVSFIFEQLLNDIFLICLCFIYLGFWKTSTYWWVILYCCIRSFNRIKLVFIEIAPLPLADTSNVKTSWIFHDSGRCECKSVPDVNEILRRRLQLYDSTGRCNRSVSTLTGLGLFLSFFLRIFHTPSYFLWFLLGPHFFRFAWVLHFVKGLQESLLFVRVPEFVYCLIFCNIAYCQTKNPHGFILAVKFNIL